MTFNEIYRRIIPLWGTSIDISDGEQLLDNGFRSKNLSLLRNEIEQIINQKDTFGDLMVWTFYQVFHKHARELFLKGSLHFDPTSIDEKEIELQYFSNLNEQSWEKELAEYRRTVE